jgi:hypothetical protein
VRGFNSLQPDLAKAPMQFIFTRYGVKVPAINPWSTNVVHATRQPGFTHLSTEEKAFPKPDGALRCRTVEP